MTKLEIISGTSFYTGKAVVGVAIKGDTVACRKWREGRPNVVYSPANVVTLKQGETIEQAAETLRATYQEWIDRFQITAVIKPGFKLTHQVF